MCLLLTRTFLLPALVVGAGSVAYGFVLPSVFSLSFDRGTPPAVTAPALPTWPLPLDVAAYNKRMLALAHYVPPAPPPPVENAASSTQVQVVLPPQPVWSATSSVSILGELWPHPAAYPHGGAILPFKRVVAYYGNLYSTKMGILGELPEEQVLAKLASTTEAWTRQTLLRQRFLQFTTSRVSRRGVQGKMVCGAPTCPIVKFKKRTIWQRK